MKLRNKSGITLIALIVTIIVLIIIAGISIATLTGDNGILKRTNSAKVTQIEGTAKEQVELGCAAMRLAIAEAHAQDNSYSAKANSNLIQSKLIDILNADIAELNGKFSNGGNQVGEDADSFIVVYKGDDYSNASNDSEAKITYTIGLTQKGIEILDEKAGSIFTVNLSTNNENAGTVSFTGEYSGTSVELKGQQEVSFTVDITSGAEFLGWYVGDTLISTDTSATYNVSTNISIVAKFELAAGLYETGSNYSVMLMSWDELISNGILDSSGKIVSGKESELGGDLVISENLTAVARNSYMSCVGLTNVVIPDGITSIGSNAFDGCTTLTSVSIPNSVTSIGAAAFQGCTNLASASIPTGVTSIVTYTFRNCSSLTSVSIPNTVTNISDSAFYQCTKLVDMTIPEGTTSIGSNAFYKCTSLENVVIPNSVTSIGEEVFSGCANVTSIKISENLKTIGSYLIAGSKIESVIIPQGVTEIKAGAFSNCANLKNVELRDGLLTIGAWAFSACTSLETIELPDSVTTLGSSFYDCTSLKNVVLSSSLQEIGSRCFENTIIESIIIPSEVENIGSQAFYNCANLASVTFEENSKLTSIGSSIFEKCSVLTSIDIPDGVTNISSSAFRRCDKLANVIIPSGVTTIGSNSFEGCFKITKFNFEGTTEQWNAITFGSSWNSGLSTYTVICTDGTVAKDGTVTLN